jgi:hypothetical protein
MRAGRTLTVLVLSGVLAACGVSVSTINARPDRYYQKKVSFSGRIARQQHLPGETLLEIADVRGGRILVHTSGPVEADTGDWVRVEGILVPEARVGDSVLYDVVTAERISRRRPPRFQNVM